MTNGKAAIIDQLIELSRGRAAIAEPQLLIFKMRLFRPTLTVLELRSAFGCADPGIAEV